jgi:histidinol-phosphate aminotransferase
MNEVDVSFLANRYIRDLIPYQPGKPIEEVERELGISSAIKLASNENPLGASPLALKAAEQALQKMHLYPDGGCYALKKALSAFLHVPPPQLTFGNGSENVLEIIIKAYLNPEANGVISQYAFLTIPLLIQSYGAQIKTVPAKQFKHDVQGMVAAIDKKTKILFVVNPNNPTGTYTTTAELDFLLQSVPPHILIVIDEAYSEYIEAIDYPNTLSLLEKYPNLVITRTFSKAYGLAGLRLGYADKEHIKKSVLLNQEGKKQLEAGIKKLFLSYIPSLGNFLAIELKTEAHEIYQQLLLKGIIVRPLAAYDMPKYIRVTVGTKDQNEQFLAALENILT